MACIAEPSAVEGGGVGNECGWLQAPPTPAALSLSFPQTRAHGFAEQRQFILPFLSLSSHRARAGRGQELPPLIFLFLRSLLVSPGHFRGQSAASWGNSVLPLAVAPVAAPSDLPWFVGVCCRCTRALLGKSSYNHRRIRRQPVPVAGNTCMSVRVEYKIITS